jgi:hypothetical protein
VRPVKRSNFAPDRDRDLHATSEPSPRTSSLTPHSPFLVGRPDMQSDVGIDDVTRKYRLGLSDALLFAPGLSALHASRARSYQTPTSSSEATPTLPIGPRRYCPRCGTPGLGYIRVHRVSTRKRASRRGLDASHGRVIRSTCGACHFVEDAPIPRSSGRAATRVPSLETVRDSLLPEENAQSPLRNMLPGDKRKSPITSTPQSYDHPIIGVKRTPEPMSSSGKVATSVHVAVNVPASSAALGTASVHSAVRATAAVNKQSMASITPAPHPAPKPKPARQKQRSSLQAMLARNREREAQDAASKNAQSGLDAFLSGL